MKSVTSIYVEQRAEFDSEAKNLLSDLKEYLRIPIQRVRLLTRFDIQGINEETFHLAVPLLHDPSVSYCHDSLPKLSGMVFASQIIPGQFDIRSELSEQVLALISKDERPIVKTTKVYSIEGNLSKDDFDKIKAYVINPVESFETDVYPPETLVMTYPDPVEVETIHGFIEMNESEIKALLSKYSLAMDLSDLLFCQNYFKNDEKRDPTIAELKILDTYWSDHCRHSTFMTHFDNISIEDESVKEAYEFYKSLRARLDIKKPECLMDIATIGAKALKKDGILTSVDESEEINACSVNVKAKIGEKEEDWLLMFKNETHNHPTEIEPFGGASTCLGGGIRDPLSGRSYVHQAMRLSGAGDPRSLETLKGKLPQRKLVKEAAAGYSSYGNQIGLPGGMVSEIYHPGFVAKRMEAGALVSAAPKENVVRKTPAPGDLILLVGAKTGRDGIGGATSSSKSHSQDSATLCGAEVQKGCATEERKIVRLFRNPTAAKMIKRCNDFGAGGVSVAIGELADGLLIDLDKVPTKYDGLNGTELALAESQERMAIVISQDDKDAFFALTAAENLETTIVATVQEKKRMQIFWRGKMICDLSRDFIDLSGTPKKTDIRVENQKSMPESLDIKKSGFEETYKALLSDLNICSKQGLIEHFDSSSGSLSVLSPLGGKTQKSPCGVMAAMLPSEHEISSTASLMAFGYNPFLLEKNTFLGSSYAVVESVSKVLAGGGSLKNCWLSFQEYFPRIGGDPARFGLPFSALLGALLAQTGLGVGAIGGKDSMSGSFENLDVPPSLISFAVSVTDKSRVIPGHFNSSESRIALLEISKTANGLPDFEKAKKDYALLEQLISDGKVLSSYALTFGGILEAVFKMSIGNEIGLELESGLTLEELYEYSPGSIVLELKADCDAFKTIGHTKDSQEIKFGGESISLSSLIDAYEKPLSDLFPLSSGTKSEEAPKLAPKSAAPSKAPSSFAKPKFFIPCLTGVNSEYDLSYSIGKAGGESDVFVFKSLTKDQIKGSYSEMAKHIKNSQALILPGGFDGPLLADGSSIFLSAVLKEPQINDAVQDLLSRGGLILGIGSGFISLLRTGLLPMPGASLNDAEKVSIAPNAIGRYQCKYVNTKIVSNNSPWLISVNPGDIHTLPTSHSMGRITASEALLSKLAENGQIATQYVDLSGNPSMDEAFNPGLSTWAIEGLLSPDGHVFGKLSHPERFRDGTAKNIYGNKDQKLFDSAINYFK